MKRLKDIISYNFKTLVSFELLYKLISSFIFVPLFLTIFKIITKLGGYNYLTLENIGSFLLNPLVIIFLIILFLGLTFYTLIDISTILIILDSSYQKIKIGIRQALGIALKKSSQVFKKKNILLPFLVIFLIPFLNIGISSSFISTIKIPEFILDFINHNTFLLVIYAIFNIILAIILFRWLYVLPYFVLENCSFKEARIKSGKLSKKNKLKDFLKIIGGQIVLFILYVIFILIGILIIILFHKIFGKHLILSSISITLIWLLIAISFVIVTLLTTPISYALISSLFYKHKETNKEEIKHINIKQKESKKIKKVFKGLKYAVMVLIILSATLLTNLILKDKLNFNIEYIRNMEVTAHRGASIKYPENTMLAFAGAKKEGADWIELDVQQTKDGKIIVLHDTNLQRTTGVNKNTWETNYDEIKDLDAGSFLNADFKDARIPLLSEVLEYAKANNINLNIELKPTGKEQDFERSVVDLIHEYNLEEHCVVTSQVYEVLENTKKYDSDITTVYVMSLAYGDILSLDYADNFSIEAMSINKTLVKKIHNAGKEVYAWTINNEEDMQRMIEYNVDNIITDNISLAKETIYKSKTSNIVQEYIKFVNDLLN